MIFAFEEKEEKKKEKKTNWLFLFVNRNANNANERGAIKTLSSPLSSFVVNLK